ncbi:hypothetical protein GE061_001246, partial [Apolygus lucorum]
MGQPRWDRFQYHQQKTPFQQESGACSMPHVVPLFDGQLVRPPRVSVSDLEEDRETGLCMLPTRALGVTSAKPWIGFGSSLFQSNCFILRSSDLLILVAIVAWIMDLQIGIFCLVIASVSSLIIYIVLSISSIKEDSFEEAKANRRKIIKQYHESKSGVDKSKDKKLKKTTKKSKKNEADEEVSSSKEIEAQGIEEKEVKKVPLKPMEEIKAVQETKKVPKSEKSKKPLPTEVSGPSTAGNPATVPNKPVAKQAGEKSSSSKASKKKNDEVVIRHRVEDDTDHKSSTTSLPVIEEPSKEIVQQQLQEPVIKHAAKPSKKKRSEITTLHQLSNEREAVNINLLVSLVQKAELSRTEIQLLIDALLNKQQEDISEWLKGRQDPQVKLKKQLTELEQALKDEKQISAGFQAKLKELRNEINADKASARHNEELIVTMQNDCKTLSVKLQQTIEENQVLATQIQQ